MPKLPSVRTRISRLGKKSRQGYAGTAWCYALCIMWAAAWRMDGQCIVQAVQAFRHFAMELESNRDAGFWAFGEFNRGCDHQISLGCGGLEKMVPLGGYKYDAAVDRIRGSTVCTRDPEEISGIRIWGGFAWGGLRYK